MNSPVGLVSSKEDLKQSISAVLDSINFTFEREIKTAIIKPNLNYYWESSTGCTTDPKFVGALIDLLRDKCGQDLAIKIAEADATAMRTKHVFPMLGYQKLASDKKVDLFNLSEDVLRKEKVEVNGKSMEFEIPQSLLSADLFINVPKLKVMRVTKISCAMKNLFGCIATPRKFVYHPMLEEAIVGVNKILHPQLTLVDGLVALGRHPVKLGLVMAGTDTFSVDWTAARLTGYNPKRVRFLQMAIREKLGAPRKILLRGESLETFKKRFPRESRISQKWLWKIQFGILRTYSRITGDVIPPFLEEG
jgi:uncharacterized protein (DUF362 family)